MTGFPRASKATPQLGQEKLPISLSGALLVTYFCSPYVFGTSAPRFLRLWRAACCGSFLHGGNWGRKFTLKAHVARVWFGDRMKSITILLNINGQGADFSKKFQAEVSNCHGCQVLRVKMPLIPSGLKALLIFLRDISTLERVSI